MELQWRHSDCRVGASANVYIHTYTHTRVYNFSNQILKVEGPNISAFY